MDWAEIGAAFGFVVVGITVVVVVALVCALFFFSIRGDFSGPERQDFDDDRLRREYPDLERIRERPDDYGTPPRRPLE
ncbi:hypothetical protein [Rhodococcus sp. HNM0569]|uniref:hypothetical protein n=1 Tax=Rhodococcus sp. HNM0569 TaxID=2716340 RepID=UPI00197FE29A|nr:hypothetical protein [Rhodococcus sp. HNM0569]